MGKTSVKNDIVLIRVVSTIMIVLCHIVKYYTFIPGHDILGTVFDVGVYVFLFVSGFLYGDKEVTDYSAFIKRRLLKIYIPAMILSITFILVLRFIYSQQMGFGEILIYLFNLQGLSFLGILPDDVKLPCVDGLGHLWFVTVIFICYLLIPLFQKTKRLDFKKQCLLLSALFLISTAIKIFSSLNLIYFVVFYFGYALSACGCFSKKKSFKKHIPIYVIGVSMQLLRIIMMMRFDNTPYYFAFVCISHTALAFMIFAFFADINLFFPRMCERIAQSKILKLMNSCSYYIYLSHGIFSMGYLNVYEKEYAISVKTLLFFLLTVAVSLILFYLDKFISKNKKSSGN